MREVITGSTIANEIRMTREIYDGTFLIVEGKSSDLKTYRALVDRDACQIIPSHSKDNAIEALNLLEDEDVFGTLAIVDADFWRLGEEELEFKNLFLTDGHDLETMILRSDALDKILVEYGSDSKLDLDQPFVDEVIKKLLNAGVHLGCLRYISFKENLWLTFEEIKFSRFVDKKNLDLDRISMVNTVINKSRRHDLPIPNLMEKMDSTMANNFDPWDLCCGHDLVALLSLGLRRAFGTNNASEVKPELIEKSLRLAYNIEYFTETSLYRSVRNWERLNIPYRLLKVF